MGNLHTPDIAETLASLLQQGSSETDLQFPELRARVTYDPTSMLEDLAQLDVAIVPVQVKPRRDSRKGPGRDFTIHIGFRQRTTTDDETAAVIATAEQVCSWCDQRRLNFVAAGESVICIDPVMVFGNAFFEKEQKELGVTVAVVECTWQWVR